MQTNLLTGVERLGGHVLTRALQALHPKHKRGSWLVLCDNESFLNAPESAAAHKKARVRLWNIPPKSPDLNPVEKFWAWLRKALARKDSEDLVKKRPVPGRTAYKERVRRLGRPPKAQQVAKNTSAVSGRRPAM